jgi:DNA gyrase subunit A
VDGDARTIPLAIEDELKESYLNYAMSVIVARALPDVRDGLKPVHRRILHAMNELGLRSDRPYVKCGRIVGDVLGRYHPHGDQAIYDSLVRMAQDFSLRYPVIQGQGNFGSLDGDPPAAVRYTEARLEAISNELLDDIDKETVDFGPNYDDSIQEPLVLPAALPNLLVNGTSGIAVGMATNMPPHNLREVSSAVIAYIEDNEISIRDLMRHVKGPDFPTGGIVLGASGMRDAYLTGRGRITVRGRLTLDTTKSGRERIVVNEIPYMVNKAALVARIAEMVNDKKIDGISDLRDESGRSEPVRIIIDLKKGAVPKVVINQLFSLTPLQTNFGVINLALDSGRPRLLNLKELVAAFVAHRKEVVTRRTRYELRKAQERAHILEGLRIALDNIDEVVETIKTSADVQTARERLMTRFSLSEIQANAILDMRLQRLTSLETQKIIDELRELRARIMELEDILAHEEKIFGIIKDETRRISEKFGDDRRTEIVADEVEAFNVEDLIQEEDMVIVISHRGLIKRMPVSSYRRQNRGGRGVSSMKMNDEDFVEQLFVASTHDYILFVSNAGKSYWLKAHEIPEGSRIARGQSIKALLAISHDEEIATILSLKAFSEETNVLLATARGVTKKVATAQFVNARTRGIIAINLDAGDKVVAAKLTHGNDELLLVTRQGKALRFHEDAVRSMGRATRGVTGIRLAKGDELAGVLTLKESAQMLLVSARGYGKRTDWSEFSRHGRGTGGQICYRVNEKSGEVVGALSVDERDDLVCTTSQGNLVKMQMTAIPVQGRNATGVRVVNLEGPDVVVGIARAAEEDAE